MNRHPRFALFAVLSFVLSACHCGGVASEEDARLSYLGLDKGIDRALNLGFAGFNAASSANIPDQTGSGEENGTMTVSGQVDQGSSDNKGMRLSLALVDYRDAEPKEGVTVTYDTDSARLPALNLSLRKIPTGTLDGTLTGVFLMNGDLEDEVTLNLTFAGQLEDAGGGEVRRKPGTTRITGSATSQYGDYAVDLTR